MAFIQIFSLINAILSNFLFIKEPWQNALQSILFEWFLKDHNVMMSNDAENSAWPWQEETIF